MGESKRRREKDPTYGVVPKHLVRRKSQWNGRGLVVSNPMRVSGRGISIGSSSLDPQELRLALLFWDRIVWPQSRAISIVDSSISYLIDRKVVERPEYTFYGSEVEVIVKMQLQAFRDLNQSDPGAWSLAQGENSILIGEGFIEEGNGTVVELHRAIPVPDKDVPFEDILEFREKRQREMQEVRFAVDEFAIAIQSASDPEVRFRQAIERIDHACAEVIDLARQSNIPFRLADLGGALDFNLLGIPALAGAFLSGPVSLANVAAAAGGVASLGVLNGPRKRRERIEEQLRTNPYRYVARFHQELFNQ